MTPSARVQAAVELLDEIIESARGEGAAADTVAARYFKVRRYAGSKDRRAIRELAFRAIRRSGERPASGREAMLGLAGEDSALLALFDGSPRGPAARAESESAAAASPSPAWLRPRLDPLIDDGELRALLERAPLDLRVNRLKATREAVALHFPGAAPTPHAPDGLRLAEAVRIEEEQAWRDGLVEVQDEGSQLVCLGCKARPGSLAVDLCAGAGGKTLALAADMDGSGRLVAADTDRQRLVRMKPRLERAGAGFVEPRLLDPGREVEGLADIEGKAALVLVDAPCSGTGTWRRAPELRWRLDEARLDRLVRLQARLLDVAARLVGPGGFLVYAVCSVLAEEGRGQAAAFTGRSSLLAQPVCIPAGRAAGTGLLLTPAFDRTDGFFIARWQRPC